LSHSVLLSLHRNVIFLHANVSYNLISPSTLNSFLCHTSLDWIVLWNCDLYIYIRTSYIHTYIHTYIHVTDSEPLCCYIRLGCMYYERTQNEGSVTWWNFINACRNLVLKFERKFWNLNWNLDWNLCLNLKFEWNLELPKNSEIIMIVIGKIDSRLQSIAKVLIIIMNVTYHWCEVVQAIHLGLAQSSSATLYH